MVRHSIKRSLAALSGACLFTIRAVTADAASVFPKEGTGPDSVQVIINWPDSFIADYSINYNTASGNLDGYDVTQVAALDPNLILAWTNYGTSNAPNYFLNNATYTGGHTSVGLSYSNSTPDNYWHEYYNNGSGWFFGNGASVDIINNGGEIGWVFGSSALPVIPEPASVSLIVAGLGLLVRRRRH